MGVSIKSLLSELRKSHERGNTKNVRVKESQGREDTMKKKALYINKIENTLDMQQILNLSKYFSSNIPFPTRPYVNCGPKCPNI